MNLLGFASMGIDKYKAVHRQWRIPESTLILLAFLGGGIGSFIGMRVFHHKLKKLKFVILLPIAAVLYIVLSGYLLANYLNIR
ncbi:MAG: DUF1294 domain-containing protein [Clostridiales bacterium]|nr:DUF1294 domain-containing protein [Clostridiales bacterium]